MSKITIDRSVVEQALEALTSYCNTGEIDGADDILASLLYEVDHADSSFAGKIARDAFIDLARQAGFKIKRFAGPNGEFPVAQMSSGHFVDIGSELATFAKLVIAALEQPQVEQEPAIYPEEAFDMGLEAVPYYTHPQNLSCKSTQARLATLWGYVKEQPPRQPLTDQQIHDCFQHRHRDKATERRMITRAIERAHGITGEQE